MYKIAICDDIEFERNQLKEFVNTYLKENNVIAKVCVFDHPDTLLNSNEAFDLYLLDIMMPMYNGIELGKILSEKSSSPIIYFTTSVDFAVEAFRLKACHYVVKPYNQDDFNAAMERGFALIKRNCHIVFEIGKDFIKVNVEHISYCETQKNYQKIYFSTDREMLSIRMTAKQLYEKLEPFGIFIQSGSRYIVNYTFIASIVKNCAILLNQTELYISTRSLKAFKKKYTLLLSEEVLGNDF